MTKRAGRRGGGPVAVRSLGAGLDGPDPAGSPTASHTPSAVGYRVALSESPDLSRHVRVKNYLTQQAPAHAAKRRDSKQQPAHRSRGTREHVARARVCADLDWPLNVDGALPGIRLPWLRTAAIGRSPSLVTQKSILFAFPSYLLIARLPYPHISRRGLPCRGCPHVHGHD